MALRSKKEVEFDLNYFNFEDLAGEMFGGDVTTAKLNPDIQGKIFAVIGGNNTGKTTQCAKMVKNSFLIPFEQGSNALGGGTQILKTANWADARKHVRKLTTNKKLLVTLKAGIPVGIIVDGLENASIFAKQYLCDNNGVEKFSKAGAHGSQWEEYANELFWFVTKLSQCGFTVFFIGHVAESKEEEGYLDFACDKRTAKPIKDVADFVIYVEANGVDEDGRVIPSSAYLAEHKGKNGFFARSRFPEVQTYFKEWDAQVVKDAIHDGIVKQAELEGSQLVSFEEVVEKYETTFDLNYDEAMDEIFAMLDKADVLKRGEEADDILLNYLDSANDLENLTKRQMQTIQAIYDELKPLFGEVEAE